MRSRRRRAMTLAHAHLRSSNLPTVLQLPPQPSRNLLLRFQGLPSFLAVLFHFCRFSFGLLPSSCLLGIPRLDFSQLLSQLRFPAGVRSGPGCGQEFREIFGTAVKQRCQGRKAWPYFLMKRTTHDRALEHAPLVRFKRKALNFNGISDVAKTSTGGHFRRSNPR